MIRLHINGTVNTVPFSCDRDKCAAIRAAKAKRHRRRILFIREMGLNMQVWFRAKPNAATEAYDIALAHSIALLDTRSILCDVHVFYKALALIEVEHDGVPCKQIFGGNST